MIERKVPGSGEGLRSLDKSRNRQIGQACCEFLSPFRSAGLTMWIGIPSIFLRASVSFRTYIQAASTFLNPAKLVSSTVDCEALPNLSPFPAIALSEAFTEELQEMHGGHLH